jgi:hypothetical protein
MIQRQKIITVVVLVIFVSVFIFFPTQAEARGFLKGLLRFLQRASKFIIHLPGKIADTLTRPLGPVLGPIAANILLSNTPNRILEVISKADKLQKGVDLFENQTKKLDAAKKILEDRADEVYKDIEELYELDAEMKKQLLSGDIKYEDYQKDFVALNKIIEAYEDTAGRLEKAAENMKPENLLKQIAGDALKVGKRKLNRIIRRNVAKEMKKLFNPEIIKKFIGEGGENVLNVVDLIVGSDATRILKGLGYDNEDPNFKELLETIKEEIKVQLKSDKDYLKGNWRGVMEDKIKEILEEYEVSKEEGKLDEFFEKYGNKNANTATNVNAESTVIDSDSDLDDELDFEDPEDRIAPDPKLPKDKNGCYPGYEWSIKVGDCIQTNCDSVTDGHYSYVLDCLCGSSGSIAEDPNDNNKECYQRSDNASCPSCLYACVGLKAECPDYPKQ